MRQLKTGVLCSLLWLIAPHAVTAQWYCLFDGQTLRGWTTLDGQPVTQGWEVIDGTIHLDASVARGGQIVTQQDYGDFELLFEWKIARGGNSGIKYRVKSYSGEMLGCEYQIIDDDSYAELRPNQLTGALYDLYAPDAQRTLHPAGAFNRGRIVVHGTRIEHWLNGRLIVAANVGDSTWRERMAASKFAAREEFGANRVGKIMLTDHQSDVWYRNLFLRPLPPPECSTGWAVAGCPVRGAAAAPVSGWCNRPGRESRCATWRSIFRRTALRARSACE